MRNINIAEKICKAEVYAFGNIWKPSDIDGYIFCKDLGSLYEERNDFIFSRPDKCETLVDIAGFVSGQWCWIVKKRGMINDDMRPDVRILLFIRFYSKNDALIYRLSHGSTTMIYSCDQSISYDTVRQLYLSLIPQH